MITASLLTTADLEVKLALQLNADSTTNAVNPNIVTPQPPSYTADPSITDPAALAIVTNLNQALVNAYNAYGAALENAANTLNGAASVARTQARDALAALVSKELAPTG